MDAAVAIKCFGVGTSYFIVIGDLMPSVMREFLHEDDYNKDSMWIYDMVTGRRFWIALLAIFLISPAIRLKKMDALRMTSGVAIACFVYVIVVVILYAIIPDLDPCETSDEEDCQGSTSAVPTQFLGFVQVIPIYIFGYVSHILLSLT